MYPQGVCRIRKPACAGNGCAIFPAFEPARIEKKIRYPAADDLFRGSKRGKNRPPVDKGKNSCYNEHHVKDPVIFSAGRNRR